MALLKKEEEIEWASFPVDVLSDDSSFIGNEETKASYEERANSFTPRDFWEIHAWNLQCLIAQEKTSIRQPPVESQALPPGLNSSVKRKLADESRIKSEDSPPSTVPKLKHEPPQASPYTNSTSTVLPTDNSPSKPPQKSNPDASVPNSPYPSEPIAAFLTRLPPSTTTLSATGHPWIHITNPHIHRPQNQQIGSFKQLAHPLLAAFLTYRTQLESQQPSKPAGSITWLLKPAREILERDILALAKSHHVTTGKWMLFPSTAEVDTVWAIVSTGTFEGRLGSGAKVAVDDETDGKPERLVCIYTEDFSDVADVRRVLAEMRRVGLVKDGIPGKWGRNGNGNGGGRVVYYKCDAYTHLDLMSGNEYKIKASMYNSRDLAKEGDMKT